MTLFVRIKGHGMKEYPVSKPARLRDECYGGTVYAYVINRKKEFKHPYYGWALPR